MNVTCTACQTVFRVDPAKLPAAGVRARCSVCSGVFWVRHPQPAAPPEPVRELVATPPVAAPKPTPEFVRPIIPPQPKPVVAAERPPEPVPIVAAPPVSPPAPAVPPPIAVPAAVVPSPVLAPPPSPPRSVAPPVVAPLRPEGPSVAPPLRRPPPEPSIGAAPPSFERPAARVVLPPFATPTQRPAPPAAPALPSYVTPAAAAPAPAPVAPPKKARVNPFLSQDPAAKARRLARALISDMVVYHPAKRREGLQNASLKRLFDEEIRKSWEEYVDQVGREMAESTAFFHEALNEILADGQVVFP